MSNAVTVFAVELLRPIVSAVNEELLKASKAWASYVTAQGVARSVGASTESAYPDKERLVIQQFNEARSRFDSIKSAMLASEQGKGRLEVQSNGDINFLPEGRGRGLQTIVGIIAIMSAIWGAVSAYRNWGSLRLAEIKKQVAGLQIEAARSGALDKMTAYEKARRTLEGDNEFLKFAGIAILSIGTYKLIDFALEKWK